MLYSFYWHWRLRRLRVADLRFAGGSLRLRRDGSSSDGVSHVGRDHVAVVSEDRMYFIPFRALRKVSGIRQKERHPTTKEFLVELIRPWVDPDVDPDNPYEIIWHTFIDRQGQELKGAILDVKIEYGINLKMAGNTFVWLKWNQLGAATEQLE